MLGDKARHWMTTLSLITFQSVGHWIPTKLPHIQCASRLMDISAGADFLGLCDQKSSYKHVFDFGRLQSYDRFKLRIEVNDY